MNENETKKKALNILNEIINKVTSDISSSQHSDLSDVSKIHEYTIMHLLNILYRYKLYNTNDISKNFPAIDLADDENKLTYQITYNLDKNKPNDTIKKFLTNKKTEPYRDYKLIIFYLDTKPKYTKDEINNFKKLLKNKFDIQDIYDLKNYANKIKLSDTSIIIKLLNFLEIRQSALFELEIFKYKNNVLSSMQDFTNKKFDEYSSKFIEFINSNDKKILYISGDGGVGKSHLTVYLMTKYIKDTEYIPVFINPVSSNMEIYDKFKNTSLKWLFIFDDIKRYTQEQIKPIITLGLDDNKKIVISSRIAEKKENINFINETYSTYINKYSDIDIAWDSKEEIYDLVKDYFKYNKQVLPHNTIIHKYIDKFASNPFLLIHGIANNFQNIKEYARKLLTDIKYKLSITNKQYATDVSFRIALNVPFGLNNIDLKKYIYGLMKYIIEINDTRYTFKHDIIGDLLLIATIDDVNYCILEDELKNQPYNKLINIRQAYSYNKLLNLDKNDEKLIKLDDVDDIIFKAFNSNDKSFNQLKSNEMIKLYKYMIEELPKTNFYLFINKKINIEDIDYYANRLHFINLYEYLNEDNYILFLESLYSADKNYYSNYYFSHLQFNFNKNIANIIKNFYENHQNDSDKEKFNKLVSIIFSNIFTPQVYYTEIQKKIICKTHSNYRCNELKDFFKWAVPKFMDILLKKHNTYDLEKIVTIHDSINDESNSLFNSIINEINMYFIYIFNTKNYEVIYSLEMQLLGGKLKLYYKKFDTFFKKIYNDDEYLLFRISKRYFMPELPVTDETIQAYIKEFTYTEFNNISDRLPNLNTFIKEIALKMDINKLVKIFCYIDIIHVNEDIFNRILNEKQDLVNELSKCKKNIKNFKIISQLYTINYKNKNVTYDDIYTIEDYFGIVNNQITKDNKNIDNDLILKYLYKIDIFDTIHKKHAAFCKLYQNTEDYYKENNILESFLPILDIFIKYINDNNLFSTNTLHMVYYTFNYLKHLKTDLTYFNKHEIIILLSTFAKKHEYFYFDDIKRFYNIFNFSDDDLLLFISYLDIDLYNLHSYFINDELKNFIKTEKVFNNIIDYLYNIYVVDKYDYLKLHNMFLDDASLFESYIYNALDNAKSNNDDDKFIFLMKLFSINTFDNSIQICFIEHAFNILKKNNQMYLLINIVNVDGSTEYDRYKSLYKIIKNSKNNRLKNYINNMIKNEANILKEYINSYTSEEVTVLSYKEPHTEQNNE